MAMLMVNGAVMPAPSTLKVTIFDAHASNQRSASGCAIFDRVASKRRLDLKWAHLDGDQLAALLDAVSTQVLFTAIYPDPQTGGARSMNCYCSDRSMGVMRMEDGAPVWTQVEMSWIER